MNLSQIIIIIMAVFSVIGGLDRILGNRLGLGKAYVNGLQSIGMLALSMAGIMVLSPVIAEICMPVIAPVSRFLGTDPSVFAGSLLACDMGGAQLALELADSHSAAQFSGILIGSTLGATISFTIPIAASSLSAKDKSLQRRVSSVVSLPFPLVLF